MARVPVFGLGVAAKSPYVTAKLMQNVYAETRPTNQAGQTEKSTLVGYQTPGMNLFVDFGSTPPRGGLELDATSFCYVVHRQNFWQVNNAGTMTLMGTLLTNSGRVSMSDNGVQIMIVDGQFGYLFQPSAVGIAAQGIASITHSTTTATLTTTAPHGLSSNMIVILTGNTPSAYNGTFEVTVTSPTTFTYVMASDPGGNATILGSYTVSAFNQIVDPSFPANPVTVTFLSGRFLVTSIGSGRFFASALFDGYTGYSLNFSNAQTNPDPILSGWVSNGQFVPLGTKSTEFWGDSGSVDFAFSLVQGTASEWGLAAIWSIAKYDNSFACLVRNRMGQVMIAQFSGYLPRKISTPDIDSIINNYASTSDATAIGYMLGGHPMYVISFPSAGASWLYDGSTGFWTSLKSLNIARWKGEFAFSYLGATIIADFSTGRLYRLTASALTENGDSIEKMLISETIADPDLDRLEVNKFRIDCEVGSGLTLGQGSNPQISLQVSRDNGKTYGAEMWRSLGPIGDYGLTLDWDMLGTARNFVFKLKWTDPVPMALVSASVNPLD